MFIIDKKGEPPMWEKDFDVNTVSEIRTRTSVFFGCGAINKIEDIAADLKSKGLDKVIVMSGRNAYKATGAWDYVEKAFEKAGFTFHYEHPDGDAWYYRYQKA